MKKVGVILATFLIFVMVPCAFANVVDITGTGPVDIGDFGTGGSDGSLWRVVIGAPVGSGTFDPFLRYAQYPTSQSGVNVGMNSNELAYGDQPPAGDGQFTHAVMFSEMATLNIGGTWYWDFTVDFNEPGADTRFLSFDQYDIYEGSTATATTTAGLNQIYNSQDTVLTDFTLASGGSGWADIEFLIPVQAHSLPYMYLYMENGQYVGGDRDWTATDGYEEVRFLAGTPNVPIPAAVWLFASGLIGLGGIKRKFKK